MRGILLWVLVLALCGCADTDAGPEGAASAAPSVAAPAPHFATGSDAFGLELYGRVRVPKDNTVIAPASVAVALAMLAEGARGETASQIEAVLRRANQDPGGVPRWNDAGKPYELVAVQRLFGDTKLQFRETFETTQREVFGAPIERADFRAQPEAARRRVNDWVKGQTRDRIREVLPAGSVRSDTRLVLVNATYLRATWKSKFDPESTRLAPFETEAGGTVDVPMMSTQAWNVRWCEKDGIQALELPYEGGDLAMLLLLPSSGGDLASLEEKLTTELLEGLATALKLHRTVMVSLPKFTIDPSGSLDLAPHLGRMGMPLAFDPTRADLTGLAEGTEGNLYLAHVFHKARIGVDEEGTEAAAATAGIVAEYGAIVPVFNADHPFVFILRDTRTNLIVFIGRFARPDPVGAQPRDPKRGRAR